MDPELKHAACSGDVEFIKKAFTSQPLEYFASYFERPNGDYMGYTGNIFHFAAFKAREEFFKEAMGLLPTHIKLQLLCGVNQNNVNPLQYLAGHVTDKRNLGMVKTILDFYKSYSGPPLNQDQKPWLAVFGKDSGPTGFTALHMALAKEDTINEKIAMEILSMDRMELPCAIVDDNKKSPLYYAVERESETVAEKIVVSFPDCSVAGPDGSTPLHFAPNSRSENVLRFLLDKHLHLINSVDGKGLNVLHKWAEIGEVWPLNFIIDGDFPAVMTKVFDDLITQTEKQYGDSPLHTATRNNNIDFVKVLVQAYQRQVAKKEICNETLEYPILKVQGNDGFTPLLLALSSKHEELALYFLSLDSSQLHINTHNGVSPFLIAIAFGCGKVVEKILTTIQEFPFNMVCGLKNGRTVIHYLPRIEGVNLHSIKLLNYA